MRKKLTKKVKIATILLSLATLSIYECYPIDSLNNLKQNDKI